jgi:hypothetical protein
MKRHGAVAVTVGCRCLGGALYLSALPHHATSATSHRTSINLLVMLKLKSRSHGQIPGSENALLRARTSKPGGRTASIQ